MTLRNVLLLAIAMCTLGGCASLPNKDPIQVTVAGLESLPEEGEGAEIRMLVKLRVQNPNDFDLPVEGLRCTLYINEREFAQGVGHDLVVEPLVDPAKLGQLLLARVVHRDPDPLGLRQDLGQGPF